MRAFRWSIRKTLLALVLLALLVRLVIFEFFWMPRLALVLVDTQSREIERQLDTITDALLPFLLSNQYAAVYETLVSISERNPDWVAIRYTRADGRPIYPLVPVDVEMTPGMVRLSRDVIQRGWVQGRLEAVVDLSPHLARLDHEMTVLSRTANLVLVILMAGIAYALDRLVIRRLKTLASAATRMAEGVFDASLPPPRPDEVGQLTDSFAEMRAHIARQTADLEAARREAEAALAAKSQFLARMSHEIRTPLNGVIPVAEALQDSPLTPVQHSQVSIIQESGEALRAIVDDILDLAKYEEGHFDIAYAPTNLAAVVQGTLRILQTSAEAKGLWLKADLPPEAESRRYAADAQRLQQVLLNLVGNAIKFTQTGGVCVALSLPEGRDGGNVVLTVTDTGIGIDAADQARIFERFEQAEGGRDRRFGGTGLGLAIARLLTEAHGGDIQLTSNSGAGSSFRVILPLTRLSDAEAAPPPPAEAETLSDGKWAQVARGRALVVDDNATNRAVAEAMLERLGFRVDLAVGGEEAVAHVAGGDYDVVLMDMHMPDLDGLEATRQIRALDGPRAQTRIIALSASVLQEDMQRCAEAGMDGFLSKPLSSRKLRSTLETSAA
jgi:signal transduction histidine kinase/CheY-like chemotaxis protein